MTSATEVSGTLDKPWQGVIPASDAEAFDAHLGADRPLDGGLRPALVVVDMTRAFADQRYPLGWETGQAATEANTVLLEAARTESLPIFFTKAYHDPSYRPSAGERGRWKHRDLAWGDRALPPGDVIMEALKPRRDEVVIPKGWRPSPFFGTTLISQLIFHAVNTVVITGMTTSGCVRAAVVDAFQFNFKVIVPHEACADRSQISHAVNLFDMHMKYCDVVSVSEALEYLAAPGRPDHRRDVASA